jgi:hypothetical protein
MSTTIPDVPEPASERPAAWEEAQALLITPLSLPEPTCLSVLDWLHRAPDYFAQLETLALGLATRRRGGPNPASGRLLEELAVRTAHLARHYEAVARLEARRDAFPATFDALRRPTKDWQREHALSCWRLGVQELEGLELAQERTLYEAAIGRLLVALQRCTTLDELVALYYSERSRPLLAEACGAYLSQQLIAPMTVLDAACWRRAQALLAAWAAPLGAAGDDGAGDDGEEDRQPA